MMICRFKRLELRTAPYPERGDLSPEGKQSWSKVHITVSLPRGGDKTSTTVAFFLRASESMGNHDSKIVDAGSFD